MQIKSNGEIACYTLCAFAIYAAHDVFFKILGVDYSSFKIVILTYYLARHWLL